jgi:uncharacterized protein YqgC (DUF456 family)
MDILLIVLGSICMLAGLAGVILPILPASPLSYLGIILLHLTSRVQFKLQESAGLEPTPEKVDQSKQGIWGCSIGVVAGMFFFPPYGLILGPVVGAVVGELLAGKQSGAALKAGLGSFLGFLLGTVSKLVVSLYLIYQFVAALF